MKKFFIALSGGTVLLVGIVLLVVPGPGLPIIAAGLAILATEFFWARRFWLRSKAMLARVRHKFGIPDPLCRLRTSIAGKPRARPSRATANPSATTR